MPQRPLLVPRPRQAERLVPRGQLHGRAAASRDSVTPSISSTMRWTLFSGCDSVRPERVDLHPVAEAPVPRVLHAVPLLQQRVPQLREGAHLAHLLDEAHPRVDEEADPAARLAEALGGTWPGACTASSTAIAVHSEKATSWTGVAPPPAGGSCRC
jgi:hypothetical protein